MITVTYLGADFNTILGHCNKTEAILRHFALNGRANNWRWLVIADDDTILSVSKLMDAIQCYDKVRISYYPNDEFHCYTITVFSNIAILCYIKEEYLMFVTTT